MQPAMARAEVVTRYHLGIDENGLGPRLGPLVVTAVMAEVAPEAVRTLARPLRGKLAQRLGDSKALMSHQDVGLGRAWTDVLVARGAGTLTGCEDNTDLSRVKAVSLWDQPHLESPCPRHVRAQCWGKGREGAAPDKALGALLKRDIDTLEARGIRICAVRSAIICVRRLNQALDEGKSRLAVDLHAMEALTIHLQGIAGQEVDAVCGKVGGIGQYGKVFGPLSGRLHSVVKETRAHSAYYFPGLGTMHFVQDCDASHLLVSLASLVGKFVRETLMDQITTFYRERTPSLPSCSGYHDPITGRFVQRTRAVRKRLNILSDCFERRGANARSSD